MLLDTHCIDQSIGSFAVYLLTLSAKVCLKGNSGNNTLKGDLNMHILCSGLFSWINQHCYAGVSGYLPADLMSKKTQKAL